MWRRTCQLNLYTAGVTLNIISHNIHIHTVDSRYVTITRSGFPTKCYIVVLHVYKKNKRGFISVLNF